MEKHIAVPTFRLFSAAAICALAAFVLFVPRASATPIVDQSYTPAGAGPAYLIESGQGDAQTFTAGVTGTLTSVDVEIQGYGGSNPSQPISLELTGVASGQPDTTALATGTILSSDVPTSIGFVHVALSAGVPVTAGVQYAIVLSTSAPGCCGGVYVTDSADGYAGGKEFVGQPGSWSEVGSDFGFVTYVAPSASVGVAPRGAYCTLPGNTTDSGLPLLPGTFVNLDDGQASSDPHYAGATPANFVQGVGLTCAAPPFGYTRHGYATADMDVDANTYPYYAAA